MSLITWFLHQHQQQQPVDALALMQEDHRRFEDLFTRLDHTTRRGAVVRARLFTSLKEQLVAHEFMEEQVIYPALRRHPEAKDLILEGLQEHHTADLLVRELSSLATTSEHWGPKCHVLGESIKHHIQEEEHQLFVQARRLLGTTQLLRLGEIMARKRQQRLEAQRARSQGARRPGAVQRASKSRSARPAPARPAARRRSR